MRSFGLIYFSYWGHKVIWRLQFKVHIFFSGGYILTGKTFRVDPSALSSAGCSRTIRLAVSGWYDPWNPVMAPFHTSFPVELISWSDTILYGIWCCWLTHSVSLQTVVLGETLQEGKESLYPKPMGANCPPFQNGRGLVWQTFCSGPVVLNEKQCLIRGWYQSLLQAN